jgi:hypothetical protein
MSDWLLERSTAVLEKIASRRGFLVRMSVVGSALATGPVRYLVRPGTAYAQVCTCSGSRCACGATCCDGWTEFCCTVFGSNTCPPGSVAAGWWKADGSGFCNVDGVAQPRYYIDCNGDCRGCGCGAGGICSGSCTTFGCGCAHGNCNNRKTGCTRFRYGQCHQELACVGPIVCRVVTCTPPWLWDRSCGTTSITDNRTRFHNAACLTPRSVSVPAILRSDQWHLRNTTAGGAADNSFQYGDPGDIRVMGDWNGNGTRTPGVFRNGRWFLRNSNSPGHADITLDYGDPGDFPVVGDWNGNGVDTVGVVRGSTWYLRNSNTTGTADIVFDYGNGVPRTGAELLAVLRSPQGRDLPVVGDWNGNGIDTPGVFRAGHWFLRNSNSPGHADIAFEYGDPGDIPVVGDWNGNGVDTPGVVRGTTWHLRNTNTGGHAHSSFDYGDPGDLPLVWARR